MGAAQSPIRRDCRRYNKDGTPIKKNGGAGKPGLKERKPEGTNRPDCRAELKKPRKSLVKRKRRANDSRKVTATPATVREGAVG
eukprot:CCRYP_011743-RA/>CCRYP_011743-RA protein AED:0.47 eAED:0.47 QI:56/-1/0/1/-1/1/1/0/83